MGSVLAEGSGDLLRDAGPMPLTAVSSSMLAARVFFTDPKCLSRAVRLDSPRPGIASSTELVIAFARFDRW